MKQKLSATVYCKYSGVPLAISTLWPKLRIESKDPMIGQPYSIVASHSKAWKHLNISQKRVLIASLLYSSSLVDWKVSINPTEPNADSIISPLLKVMGELEGIPDNRKSKFPRIQINKDNSKLEYITAWISSLSERISQYNKLNRKQIDIDDKARSLVYSKELEKNFTINIVTSRSFSICFEHMEEILTPQQKENYFFLTSLSGLTYKQVTKKLSENNINVETLKTLREIVYSCVPDKPITLVPHKVLIVRWFDFIITEYNELISSITGDELMITAQLIGGVVVKTSKVMVDETSKPKLKDYANYQAYFAAYSKWRKENE